MSEPLCGWNVYLYDDMKCAYRCTLPDGHEGEHLIEVNTDRLQGAPGVMSVEHLAIADLLKVRQEIEGELTD